MAGPTDEEQFYLELINETRLDPLGNAARYISSYDPLVSPDSIIQNALSYFNVDGTKLLNAYRALVPVAPVAWSDTLASAARTHNGVMIANDSQTHQAPGEASLGQRITDAGYTNWSGLGENIFAFAQTTLYGHAGFMVDWGFGPDGMQSPPGHRNNIMNASWTEIGVGVTGETNPSTDVGPKVVTQDLGTRGKAFVLGVSYADSDHDDFYTPGEGRSGLQVAIGAANAVSTSSGGYALEVAGHSNVTAVFSGGGLAHSASVTFANFAGNVKLDIVDAATLKISSSATVSGFDKIIVLGTAGLTLTAGEGAQEFSGNKGNDHFDGGSNVDSAVVSGNQAQYIVTQTSVGVFQVVGADGTDTLTNVEYLRFDDQTIRLLPGTGTSVDFNTADPSIYRAAMANIRDFDGNALGGDAGWLRIGSADVNGDGDIDQILVNRSIGRFAEVGTAPDGKVYFDDHGWAGETRVVGIYVDPLVETGEVAAGSDFDSQRRFQNDLDIENINRVLGAGDYDGDGLQEVYLALTNGTAYLHAYMHADGNIRYANYQSQAQVIDYLTGHGYDSSAYNGWFG